MREARGSRTRWVTFISVSFSPACSPLPMGMSWREDSQEEVNIILLLLLLPIDTLLLLLLLLRGGEEGRRRRVRIGGRGGTLRMSSPQCFPVLPRSSRLRLDGGEGQTETEYTYLYICVKMDNACVLANVAFLNENRWQGFQSGAAAAPAPSRAAAPQALKFAPARTIEHISCRNLPFRKFRVFKISVSWTTVAWDRVTFSFRNAQS